MLTDEATPREHIHPAGMLVVLLLVVAATAQGWGWFSWERLVLLLGATAFSIHLHFRKKKDWRGPPAEAMLIGLVIAFTAMVCFLQTGLYELKVADSIPHLRISFPRLNGYGMAIHILSAGALLITLTYLGRKQNAWHAIVKYRFVALVLIAIAMRILILFSSPDPKIDVFAMQKAGAPGLLNRENVYAMKFRSDSPLQSSPEAMKHYGYAYPPASVYPVALAWLAFKEVRVAWVLCDLIAALLLFRLALRANPGAERARFRQLVTLAFLFLPRTLFVLEQSWTEPLVAVALAGLAVAVAGGRGPFATGAMLGLWLTSKQYVCVALPLLFKLRKWRITTWLYAAATAILLALPFVLWDWDMLFSRVVVFFLKSPGRPDALSIYGGLLRLGLALPLWVVAPLWIAGLITFFAKMRPGLAGWLFSTACMWLYFFMLGKQAFMNYFYLIAFALLLAVAASKPSIESNAQQ